MSILKPKRTISSQNASHAPRFKSLVQMRKERIVFPSTLGKLHQHINRTINTILWIGQTLVQIPERWVVFLLIYTKDHLRPESQVNEDINTFFLHLVGLGPLSGAKSSLPVNLSKQPPINNFQFFLISLKNLLFIYFFKLLVY